MVRRRDLRGSVQLHLTLLGAMILRDCIRRHLRKYMIVLRLFLPRCAGAALLLALATWLHVRRSGWRLYNWPKFSQIWMVAVPFDLNFSSGFCFSMDVNGVLNVLSQCKTSKRLKNWVESQEVVNYLYSASNMTFWCKMRTFFEATSDVPYTSGRRSMAQLYCSAEWHRCIGSRSHHSSKSGRYRKLAVKAVVED